MRRVCGDASAAERVCHIFRPHVGAQFPRDDIAAVIIQDRAEIEPAPADDLQISEVSLPELVDRCRLRVVGP